MFFFSSRRRHTRSLCDWSSDVCSSDLGAEAAPAVVLSHSLATKAEVWGYQLPLLSRHFRVILYDVRGHGESEASRDSYSLEELANDVVKLLDHLSIARAALVGISLGGMI